MRQSDRFVSSSIFVLLIVLLGWTPLGAQEQIDWEGLPAGTFLCGSAPPPAGETCTTIQSAAGDPILIDGFDPDHGIGVNAAMIFDSNNPTGGDVDLGSPNETCDNPGPGIGAGGEKGRSFENCPLDAGQALLDNVLIISEDLDPTDPDDSARRGTQITVDFSQLEGVVTLFSMSLLDLEQRTASVQIFDAGDNLLFNLTPIPRTGDNGLAMIPFNGPSGVSGVARIVVLLNGSGSIDTIVFLQEEETEEPAIDIRKQAEGPDTRTFPSGSDVTFEIVVTNTGAVDLDNVEVTDVLAPDCDRSIGFLAAGDSVSYPCTVPNVTASFDNEACVEGTAPDGTTVDDCDPSTVEIIDIDIRKQAEGPDSRTFPSGSDVTFEIVVTNTGDEDLVNVVVTDVLAPQCDNNIGFLAAGDSVTYTCTMPSVTQGFENEVCVAGERNGVTVGDCDPSTVEIIDIDIRKQAEGPDSRTFPSGSVVPFDIVVTNTGPEDLENVVVTDVLVPECDRNIGDLAAGDSVSYTCTALNVTVGFTNEACVAGERNSVTVGDCDPSTVVIESPGCTHTWGYWKTHSEYGPAPYDDTWAMLPNGADTPFFGTGKTYYQILQTTSAGGNKYIGLAHQYIAAELSVLSGASMPPEVQAGWFEAQALLIKYEGIQNFPRRSADRRRAVQLATLLDQYNKGEIGPGHCP